MNYQGSCESKISTAEYLESALAAIGIILLVAGTVASAGVLSPAATAAITALGVSLAVVNASLSARNMAKRKEKGTLALDVETAIDIVSIIGSVVMVGGTVSRVILAAQVARSASLPRGVLTLQRINRLIAIYDATELVTNAYLINVKVEDDIKAIKALGLPKEQEERLILAVAIQAVQQGAMLGVSFSYGTLRRIPDIYQSKVSHTGYKSWKERGWVKVKGSKGGKTKVEIQDSAPPLLRKLKSKPKAGSVAVESQQGEMARKAVVVDTLENIKTKDGQHLLTITGRGRIIRCSNFCADLRFKYQKILKQDPELWNRLTLIEQKAQNAATTSNKQLAKKLAKEVLKEAKELEGRLSWADTKWKKIAGVSDEEIDQVVSSIGSTKLTGGKKSGFKIEGRRVPKRQRRRIEVLDIMILPTNSGH